MRIRSALALFLCVQPMFWMSDVALAQSLEDRARAAAGLGISSPQSPGVSAPGPLAPTDTEIFRRDFTAVVPDVPAIDEPLDPDKYICGPGDVLQLNFWGVQNFNLRVIVDMENRAFVSRVGFFDLQGKTLSEARRIMRASVASYFPRLQFDVTLAEPRSFLVQVAEAVPQPGTYQARAVDRVSSVITKAGGLAENASRRRIEVRRRDGSLVQADLLMWARTGDVKYNPFLLDGDVVRVPYETVVATIGGAVNRAGRYELVGSRDLAELVEAAGGLSPAATQQLPVRVVRRTLDERHDQRLIGFGASGELPSFALQHDDAITIPSFSELQQSVMVIGAIVGSSAGEEGVTRRLPFVEGDSVRTLLERAGGVGPNADFSGAYVIRNGKSLPVDLYALLMLRDLKADLAVELGDTVVVPLKRRSISVEGAVFKPGPLPYNPSFGAQHYISLAGGPNRFAMPLSQARVITPDGQTTPYRADLAIPPGSSVVVPERNFSRSELVQIGLGIAGILLSGVAVVLAAQ